VKFVGGPLHGNILEVPDGTSSHQAVYHTKGGGLRTCRYVPHPTYPGTQMVLDTRADRTGERDIAAMLSRNPRHISMDSDAEGSTDIMVWGYKGKAFSVDDILDALVRARINSAVDPETVTLTMTLRRS